MFVGNATNLDLKILISEMELMATIGCHTNVIGFLGACTTGKKHSILIVQSNFPFVTKLTAILCPINWLLKNSNFLSIDQSEATLIPIFKN